MLKEHVNSTTVQASCEHPKHVMYTPTGALSGRCVCGRIEACQNCGGGKQPGQMCTICMKRTGNTFAERWRCECYDPGLKLFTASLKASGQDIAIGADVLEIGCAEADWLTLAHAADPTLKLTGLDWRSHPRPHATVIQGDVLEQDFGPVFDVIVSISAIEHIGLGHYDSDPIAKLGDVQAMQNARSWLKPGGRMYLDVPYGRWDVVGDSHRVYNDTALNVRLLDGWNVLWQGWAKRQEAWTVTTEKPQGPWVQDFDYYVAMWVTPCS